MRAHNKKEKRKNDRGVTGIIAEMVEKENRVQEKCRRLN